MTLLNHGSQVSQVSQILPRDGFDAVGLLVVGACLLVLLLRAGERARERRLHEDASTVLQLPPRPSQALRVLPSVDKSAPSRALGSMGELPQHGGDGWL